MKREALIIQCATFAAAAIIAASLIYGFMKGEKKFKEMGLENRLAKAQKIQDSLASGKDHSSKKRPDHAYDAVAGLEEKDLSPAEKRQLLIIHGDINVIRYEKASEPKIRQYYLDMAVKYFSEAAGMSESKEEKNEILRRNALLYVDNKDWQKALNMLKEAESNQMLPEERWKLLLQQAECLAMLGRRYEQLQVLSQVSDESDDRDIWGHATLKKGALLLAACRSPEIMKSLVTPPPKAGVPSPEADSTTGAENTARLQKEARAAFEKILKDLPGVSQYVSEAEVGLLELAIMDHDRTRAYEIGNKILAQGGAIREKAHALLLLSTLEESSGKLDEAIHILEVCLKRYPKSSFQRDICVALYRLYSNTEAWEKAFNILEELFVHEPDSATLVAIMRDLSGNGRIIEILSTSENKDKYAERMEYMLSYVRKTEPAIWMEIQNDAYLLFARVLFLNGKYDRAEKELELCLNMSKNTAEQLEKIYYLDMSCAIKAKRPPVVCIARARRYLNSFPKGEHYQEAFMNMLDCYYNMGLFNAAIDISKKIYVDDLAKDESYAQNPFWLKTIARIGQCYQQLGDYEKANKILRANSKHLLDKPYAGEVFLSWARDAERMKQKSEAIRRLDLVLPQVVDMNMRAEIYVAQYLLKLKDGNIEDYRTARYLLTKISTSKMIEPEKKKELRRNLYEGLLKYAFEYSPDQITPLLDEVIPEFKDQNWPEIWILKSLSRIFENTKVEVIAQKHRETLEKAYKDKDTETVKFIRRQIELMNGVVEIKNYAEKLKNAKGL